MNGRVLAAIDRRTAVADPPGAAIGAGWRRRRGVVGVVGGVLAAAALWSGVRPSTGGPLSLGNPHGWATVQPVGARFTDGFDTLRFTTDQPVTIVAVRPRLSGDGLRYLGSYLAGDGRITGAIQYTEGFPPHDPAAFGEIIAAEGVTIPADPGPNMANWNLLMGYEVVRPGRWTRTEVDVHYRVGWRRYVAHIPATLAVCTPEVAADEEDCEFEYGAYGS